MNYKPRLVRISMVSKMTSLRVYDGQFSELVLVCSFFYLMTAVQGGPIYLPAQLDLEDDAGPSSFLPPTPKVEDTGVEFLIDYDKSGDEEITAVSEELINDEELLEKAEESRKVQELLDSALFDVQVPDEDEEEEEMYDRRDNDWQLAPILMDQPTFDKRQSGDYTIQDFQVPLRGDAQMADAPDDSDGEEKDERRTWRRTPRQLASRLRPPLTRQDALDLPDEDPQWQGTAQGDQEFYEDRSGDDDDSQAAAEDAAQEEEEDAELQEIATAVAQLQRQRQRRNQLKKARQQLLQEKQAQYVTADQYLDEDNAAEEPTRAKRARGRSSAGEEADRRVQHALRRLKRQINRQTNFDKSSAKSLPTITNSVKKQKKKQVKLSVDKKASKTRSKKETVHKLQTVSLADARKSANADTAVTKPSRTKRQAYFDQMQPIEGMTGQNYPTVYITSADMEEPTELNFLELDSDQVLPVPTQLMRRKRRAFTEEDFNDGQEESNQDEFNGRQDRRWDFDGATAGDEKLLAGIERPGKDEQVDSSIAGRYRVCKMVKEKFHKSLSFTGKTLEVDECLVTCERRVEQRTFSHIFKLVDWPCGSRLEGTCQKDGSCSAF